MLTVWCQLKSRKDVVSELISEGRNITERTIRYWSYCKVIPKPAIINRIAYFDDLAVDIIRMVYDLRGKSIADIKLILENKESKW